jgi:alpha-beta hydrolase superfamily lysophospholipase
MNRLLNMLFARLSLVAMIGLAGCAPTVVPGGKVVQTPSLQAERYVATDGTARTLTSWPLPNRPREAPKAVILGIHGFGDYRNAWEDPAEIWAAMGITTYAYDQRGFGSSPTRGRWAGVETMVNDIRTVVALVRQKHPGVPFYLAGESMGGALVLAAADSSLDVDGLILVATALRSRDTLGPLASGALSFFAHTVPWLPAGPTSIDFQPTDNPRTMEKMRKDPLVLRNPRVDLGFGLVEAMDAGKAAAPNVGKPYLMLHGLRDRLVPIEPVRSTIAVMPRRSDSHLAFYRNGYHMLLRDKEAALIAKDIASWIDNKEAPLPSGADARASRPELDQLWGSKRSD